MSGQKLDPANADAPGTEKETARYVFDMLVGLSAIARKNDLVFLGYLIEMAASEAARVAEKDESGPAG